MENQKEKKKKKTKTIIKWTPPPPHHPKKNTDRLSWLQPAHLEQDDQVDLTWLCIVCSSHEWYIKIPIVFLSEDLIM
jgi:hypothetical protein